MTVVTAFAPGRVNLIGDHTDYSGGLACPMAIDLGTTVTLERGGASLELTSEAERHPASVPIDVVDPAALSPPWARYVAGVVAVLRPATGGRGRVATTLPIGAGLSSSAALEVALALALGAGRAGLAASCQQAEHLATGVPSGIMDQLASVSGRAGHALVIDCATLAVDPVAVPEEAAVVVVHSGQSRALVASAYAERHASVSAAAALVGGPLRVATAAEVGALTDPDLRRRARHVVGENARVLAFAGALAGHDLATAGALMNESHASLRDDFEVSTAALDALVARLQATPGVWGARLTGAGFGGCAVALAEPGAVAGPAWGRMWVVTPSAGARVRVIR